MKRILLCFFGLSFSIEVLFRFFDDPMSADFLFGWFFWDTTIDRNVRYHTQLWFDDVPIINSDGFRAGTPWPPKLDSPHILISAAGHGFAENVLPHESWPALLEQHIHSTGQQLHIHNASVQGATIIFTERVLLPLILKSQPKAVILSMSGFNEAIRSHIPETQVVLPKSHLHNMLMGLTSLRKARQWVASYQQPLQHKVTIPDFISSYNRIIEKLSEAGIKTILLQQVVIHPDISPIWSLEDMTLFREAQQEVGRIHNLPVIDPLPYCQPHIEACFDKLEWYSLYGHQQVVHAIQQSPIWAELTEMP